jgi:DnaJ-class molecular chaperone
MLPSARLCPDCDGVGDSCDRCEGRGVVQVIPCPSCDGRGQLVPPAMSWDDDDRDCYRCGGSGFIERT